jgi:hypothetical protein
MWDVGQREERDPSVDWADQAVDGGGSFEWAKRKGGADSAV